MTGLDYVAKRVAFACATVLAAVTLNFVLFRAIPGDAVQALRCQHCTVQFKNALRKELGLDKSKWEQYKRYLVDLAHGDLGSSVRSQQPVWDELWPSIKNTMPMIALGYLFAIFFGTIVGVIAAWRRGTLVEKAGLWSGLSFYSMPPQWLGLMIVLFVAGAVGLPLAWIWAADACKSSCTPSWARGSPRSSSRSSTCSSSSSSPARWPPRWCSRAT